MKAKLLIITILLAVTWSFSACGGPRRREARARERERRHQEAKDQLDRDKKNFGKTFENEGKED